ncbi:MULTISPECIES: HAMP domain-containing sensor histidine kinase [unclassified Pseudomonas]|jgi:signal transduction histidine kinase|uniref:sensor histidine kinase n=2 Tax=Pseudomonas TaxID=286 RepID=UPI000C851CC2|nr:MULTISPECIES: HAMP domain-containing sensor histidine kinase [unclassified Pseudomonas]AUO25331.1 two-component sensor histidine kinase [Pseudomonas sp. NC02]NVZ18002.1 HAMP domain-containing protein [Pseudomonas sp. IPO3775]NVZ34081.1 HAMP domain-containing protein [Pseudomonas sp. A4002]NWA32325.1 HAMP domain-containing protein [Pseudomonas sp. C6002]NWA80933.1 HAMP domain-containing protein [Pseudomonas sp. C8002]
MINKTRQKARPFAISRWSVQRKLVLAFWLVTVIPTMIAAELAATTLSQIFDSNVRIWLQESTKIVKDEIGDILHDNARVAQLFLRYTKPPSSRQAEKHDKLTADIAAATDIDVVALIRSSDHKIVFTTAADDIVKQINLASNAVLQTVEVGGVTTGVVVSTFETSEDGVDYQLLVATYLDSSFLTSVADVHSLDLRLYLANPSGFSEIFSTQRFVDHPARIPSSIESALRSTKQPSEQFTNNYSGLYWPIFNDAGELQGVIFSGLLRHTSLVGLVNQSNLFVLIFLLSSALSLGAGMLVSQRLTRPLRDLSEGVSAVISGNYQHRVAVSGGDELAQLSSTFNHMTERLGELHHLEAQLRRRDRLHALGEVAMGLAHEIRNPLGIIKTATQLLHRRADLPETDKRHLEYVISEVSRINDLITEFLDFAKPSAPLRTVQAARPVVEEILGFCGPELATHNIDAQIDDAAPGATIYADAKQLKQACLNLILNAIDAMPGGGRLTLGIHSVGGNTVISIGDTGEGIAPDMIERIFTPFVTTKASGTGLGLAKVFSIMESHDGSIECVSETDAGATFSLYIPAQGADDGDDEDGDDA